MRDLRRTAPGAADHVDLAVLRRRLGQLAVAGDEFTDGDVQRPLGVTCLPLVVLPDVQQEVSDVRCVDIRPWAHQTPKLMPPTLPDRPTLRLPSRSASSRLPLASTCASSCSAISSSSRSGSSGAILSIAPIALSSSSRATAPAVPCAGRAIRGGRRAPRSRLGPPLLGHGTGGPLLGQLPQQGLVPAAVRGVDPRDELVAPRALVVVLRQVGVGLADEFAVELAGLVARPDPLRRPHRLIGQHRRGLGGQPVRVDPAVEQLLDPRHRHDTGPAPPAPCARPRGRRYSRPAPRRSVRPARRAASTSARASGGAAGRSSPPRPGTSPPRSRTRSTPARPPARPAPAAPRAAAAPRHRRLAAATRRGPPADAPPPQAAAAAPASVSSTSAGPLAASPASRLLPPGHRRRSPVVRPLADGSPPRSPPWPVTDRTCGRVARSGRAVRRLRRARRRRPIRTLDRRRESAQRTARGPPADGASRWRRPDRLRARTGAAQLPGSSPAQPRPRLRDLSEPPDRGLSRHPVPTPARSSPGGPPAQASSPASPTRQTPSSPSIRPARTAATSSAWSASVRSA